MKHMIKKMTVREQATLLVFIGGLVGLYVNLWLAPSHYIDLVVTNDLTQTVTHFSIAGAPKAQLIETFSRVASEVNGAVISSPVLVSYIPLWRIIMTVMAGVLLALAVVGLIYVFKKPKKAERNDPAFRWVTPPANLPIAE